MTAPGRLGYRMPAEWEPQDAVWLAWPHNPETWPGDALVRARACYAEIIGSLAGYQRVRLLVEDEGSGSRARDLLVAQGVDLSNVSFLDVPTADTWIRDYGPTFVVRPGTAGLAMVAWEFNAWGGKYADLMADNGIPARLAPYIDVPLFEAGWVLEGGSIDVNGQGLVLTTEQCLLNPNRNPELSRSDLEARLADFIGAGEVIWLGEGIVGDDTDGHVDDIARFVDSRTVVCAVEEDPEDDNYRPLRDNYERLTRFRDRGGRPLRVVRLPMPRPVVDAGGARLPASYANFYIGNGIVAVPVFADPADAGALGILRKCFPDRSVAGIDCRALVPGLGAIHCCTQQQPSV